jgi:predicted restriction endonuclease
MYKYNSARYKTWRSKVFYRDRFKCQMCGQGGTVNAHHIKRKSQFPKLAHRVSNGITLCKTCHEIITRHEELFERLYKKIIAKKITFDFVCDFFYNLTEDYKDLVRKFKTKNKWLKIASYMEKLIGKHQRHNTTGRT